MNDILRDVTDEEWARCDDITIAATAPFYQALDRWYEHEKSMRRRRGGGSITTLDDSRAVVNAVISYLRATREQKGD